MEKRVNSGIGGQAVIEGIMMRNKDQYAIAVRKPDQEIAMKIEPVKGGVREGTWKNIPLIRGVFAFVDSLVTGMHCLMYSAEFFVEEEETEAEKKKRAEEEENLTEEEIRQLREKQKKKREKKIARFGTPMIGSCSYQKKTKQKKKKTKQKWLLT